MPTTNGSQYLLSTIGNSLNYKPIYTHHVGKKRYYSAVDATVYFGTTALEEIINITWTVQEGHMPLFGYNSYTFDEMAVGSRIVQGQFAINFIIPDYLNLVLGKLTNDLEITYKNTGAKQAQSLKAPVWKTSFDISISLGKEDSITGKTPYIFLEDVYVQSQGSALDPNGGGIVEIYSFVSRNKSASR